MYFVSPDVQCGADSGQDTGNKLSQRRFLQIKSVLHFFLHKEEEKPCHLPEGEKDSCSKEVTFILIFEFVVTNNARYQNSAFWNLLLNILCC